LFFYRIQSHNKPSTAEDLDQSLAGGGLRGRQPISVSGLSEAIRGGLLGAEGSAFVGGD